MSHFKETVAAKQHWRCRRAPQGHLHLHRRNAQCRVPVALPRRHAVRDLPPEKEQGIFTNSQKKKPAGSHKCSACAAATGGTAEPAPPQPSDQTVSAEPAAMLVATSEPQTPASDASANRTCVCAWSGCGRALSSDAAEEFKCGRCKQAFYCGRPCQKRHWSHGGHEELCAEPPCCTFYLDGGDEPVPVQRGCACRGDAAARVRAPPAHAAPRRPRAWLGAEVNLGLALMNACKFTEAAAVLTRVLTAMKRAHGEDDTAGMLAHTHCSQGQLAEVEEVQVWVLEVCERVQGKEHPDTLAAGGNLASTCSEQGKHAEADKLRAGVLAVTLRVLGPEHPGTILHATNLAIAYIKLGKLAEAEVLLVDTLPLGWRVRGAAHPGTLNIARVLACACDEQGKDADAEELRALYCL